MLRRQVLTSRAVQWRLRLRVAASNGSAVGAPAQCVRCRRRICGPCVVHEHDHSVGHHQHFRVDVPPASQLTAVLRLRVPVCSAKPLSTHRRVGRWRRVVMPVRGGGEAAALSFIRRSGFLVACTAAHKRESTRRGTRNNATEVEVGKETGRVSARCHVRQMRVGMCGRAPRSTGEGGQLSVLLSLAKLARAIPASDGIVRAGRQPVCAGPLLTKT